jgi:hypothetical protein
MEDMITLDGCNSIDELAGKLAKNFGRYKRGEITSEECDRLNKEILEIENKRIEKAIADMKADVERNNQ